MTALPRRGLPPLGLALLAACADGRRADRGIGGTGVSGDGVADRGIGGTGVSGDGVADRGIGGTGIGGVGVIGTVTALGSFWVNGLRLEFPAAPRITLEGEPAAAGEIRPGHVVAARATSEGLALAVDLRIAVAGPVQSRDAAGFWVLGQRCALESLAEGSGAALAEPGRWVAVSGLRRADGAIAATRLQAWPEARGWLLRGEWSGAGLLAGVAVELAPGLAEPAAGAALRATGRLDAGRLLAQSLRPVPANPFGGAVGRVLVETYLDSAGRVPRELGARDLALGPPGERVVYAARVTGPAGGLAPAGIRPAPSIGERGLPGAPPQPGPPPGPGPGPGQRPGPGPGGGAAGPGGGQANNRPAPPTGPGGPAAAPQPYAPPPSAAPPAGPWGGVPGGRGAPPPSAPPARAPSLGAPSLVAPSLGGRR